MAWFGSEMIFSWLLLLSWISVVLSAAKNKPHSHQGSLQPYDGRPLPDHLTSDQKKKLDLGDAVIYNERDGKSGYGVVVQDINATTITCMDKISDLKNYPKMVPHVKNVDIYEKEVLRNGSSRIGAQFTVGLMGLSFGYFLKLRHEPKHNTFTWTQDYRHTSDFDDNVGHWQVAPHPSRQGWTRLLYSCKVKLLPWIPEFVVSFLTTKALTEATGWVKREAEAEQRKQALAAPAPAGTCSGETPPGSASAGAKGRGLMLPAWLGIKGGEGQDKDMGIVTGRGRGSGGEGGDRVIRGARLPGTGLVAAGLAKLRIPAKFGRL